MACLRLFRVLSFVVGTYPFLPRFGLFSDNEQAPELYLVYLYMHRVVQDRLVLISRFQVDSAGVNSLEGSLNGRIRSYKSTIQQILVRLSNLELDSLESNKSLAFRPEFCFHSPRPQVLVVGGGKKRSRSMTRD